MSKPAFVDNPPFPDGYLTINDDGKVLATSSRFEEALKNSRDMTGAVCILGAPAGVLLARIAHGIAVEERRALRAIKMWRKAKARTEFIAKAKFVGDPPRMMLAGTLSVTPRNPPEPLVEEAHKAIREERRAMRKKAVA